jgi:hypothetical protein
MIIFQKKIDVAKLINIMLKISASTVLDLGGGRIPYKSVFT